MAVAHDGLIQIVQVALIAGGAVGIVAVDEGPSACPLDAPFKGADNPIGIGGGEPGLPVDHPFFVEPAHVQSVYQSCIEFEKRSRYDTARHSCVAVLCRWFEKV